MQSVQRSKDDVFLLRKQCESKDLDILSLNATIEELQCQIEELNVRESQRKSLEFTSTQVVVMPPEPVVPKTVRPFQPMNFLEVLESWGGKESVGRLLERVDGKLLVKLIESESVAQERLAKEIYILETQLARCAKAEPAVSGVVKPTESMLLSRITSLETQLSQARFATKKIRDCSCSGIPGGVTKVVWKMKLFYSTTKRNPAMFTVAIPHPQFK